MRIITLVCTRCHQGWEERAGTVSLLCPRCDQLDKVQLRDVRLAVPIR